MKTDFLYNYISKHRYATLCTVTPEGHPEAALIGFAVAPDLRLIFDTVSTSRKYINLIRNNSVALVIGWEDEQTVQYEGRVIFQAGNEFNKMLKLYFQVFPDGKERHENWNDIVYFVIVPEWIRYSDFKDPLTIEETDFLPNKIK
jgi:uncharacterized pyridoxamine 5'-phosphate oxidase family protein